MEKFFKLKEHGTTVGTEIVAGLTTFFTMAYIIFVNPAILANAGMDKGAVMLATCIAAAVGTLIMGLYAKIPFAQAPGMGLNAFFAFTIVLGLGYSWEAALAAVFLSGILFIIITLTGLRAKIVNAIPAELKKAISGGIGLFIAYIGIKNAGFLTFTMDPGTYTISFDTVFGNSSAIPAFHISSASAVLAVIGLVLTIILVAKGVKGGLFISILGTSLVGAFMQFVLKMNVGIMLPSFNELPSLAPTFGKFVGGFGSLFSFAEGLGVGLVSIITVLISLTLVDMFDTIGTLVGTASRAGMLDKDGNLPNVNKALMADAIATSVGAVLGTSTVTTYVESSAGISVGGKTGLTSVTVGILFLLAIVAAPFLGLVPGAATAPVLIVVGVLMMGALKDLDWSDFEIAAPCFMTVAMMPFAYSIAEGIGLGFITYVIIKLVKGKAKSVDPILWVVAALFLARFFLLFL